MTVTEVVPSSAQVNDYQSQGCSDEKRKKKQKRRVLRREEGKGKEERKKDKREMERKNRYNSSGGTRLSLAD